MTNLNLEEIHSGYLIELKNGSLWLCLRANQNKFTKIFVDMQGSYFYASNWDVDGRFKGKSDFIPIEGLDINRVYGLCSKTDYYPDVMSIEGRPLLWYRKEVRLTLDQIKVLIGAAKDTELIIEIK